MLLQPSSAERTGIRPQWAIAALLFGATLWGLYWLPLRRLEQAGLNGLWALAFVYLGATLVLLVPARHVLRPWQRSLPAMAGIGLTGAISGIAFGLGVIEGEVARVLMWFYLAPVWSVLFARFVLHERLTRLTLPALVMALAGAAMMLLGGERGTLAQVGRADALGLLAGLAFAATNLQLRAGRALPLALKTLASAYLVPPLAVALALLLDRPLVAAGAAAGPAWGWVLAAALLLGAVWMSTMLGAVQVGVRALPLQRSSVLLLFELIVGAVSAAVIAGEALGPWELGGGLCIVVAGLAAVWPSSRRGEPRPERSG
jgi:drug/metabolite transporter (DMT)-like permease